MSTAPYKLADSATKVIRLGITDLSFHHATGGIVAAVMRHMGYTVECSYAAHEANFERLRLGEIDMIASAWLPFSHGIYKARVEHVIPTRELGLHYRPYAMWGVADFVPENEVAEISDLLKPSVRKRMTPLIQGIGPGAGITRFSLAIMEKYGLDQVGYHFRSGTQEECITAFEEAVNARRWAVVPLWQPQYLHACYRIRALKDPEGLLGDVDRAVLLVREDRLDKLSAHALRVLDNIRLSNAIVAALDYDICRNGNTIDQAASAWLNTHSSTLAAWLNPDFSLDRTQSG